MVLFLDNFLSFPVVIYSGLLVVIALYWLITAFGMLDVDILDIDGPDIGDMGDLSVEGGGEAAGDGLEAGGNGLAGRLFALGLYGVPMTFILTLVVMFGWLLSYFGMHLALRFLEPGLIRYGLGFFLFAGSFIVAALLTGVCLRPFRPLFNKNGGGTRAQSLQGQTVIIRSAAVTADRGEAIYEDGGASLILQVRSLPDTEVLSRGDRAVILEYQAADNTYTVISENEFRGA